MKRLTPAALTMMMFGVVGLLVVAYIAKSLLAVEEKKPEVAMRNIPMAVADIEPGTVITETHLGQGPYPVSQLGRDTLLVNRVVVGRVAKELIPAAQPIRANQLYKPGELPPLEVAEGLRAVSIEIADSVGMVDGLVRPGQYVDILFTYRGLGDDRVQGGITMRLCEGVRVLAINRNMAQGRPERNGNRVTLELTEQQSNVVVLAEDAGALTLTFNPKGRGNGSLALSSSERVTLFEILGMRPPEAPPEPFVTETYRGSAHDTIEFSHQGRRTTTNRQVDRDPNRLVLPNSSPPGATPDIRHSVPAPSDDRTVPGPQDAPAPRSPTASRAAPTQK
jgi:pilus assembly protein CpaB